MLRSHKTPVTANVKHCHILWTWTKN